MIRVGIIFDAYVRYCVVEDNRLVACEGMLNSDGCLDEIYSKLSGVSVDSLVIGLMPYMLPSVVSDMVGIKDYSLSPIKLYECFSKTDLEKLDHFIRVINPKESRIVSMMEWYKALAGDSKCGVVEPITGGISVYSFNNGNLCGYDDYPISGNKYDEILKKYADSHPEFVIRLASEPLDDGSVKDFSQLEYEVQGCVSFTMNDWDSDVRGSDTGVNSAEADSIKSDVVPKEEISKGGKKKKKKGKDKKRVPAIDVLLLIASLGMSVFFGYKCYLAYGEYNDVIAQVGALVSEKNYIEDRLDLIESARENSKFGIETWDNVSDVAGVEPKRFRLEDGKILVSYYSSDLDTNKFVDVITRIYKLDGKKVSIEDGKEVVTYELSFLED